jgi:hypothetical protein
MVVDFIACDRDSGGVFTKTVTVTTHDELEDAWKEFDGSVPFRRWYSDNQLIEGTPEDKEALNGL